MILILAQSAEAAPARTRRFSIPAEPVQAALIDFALQANVNLGGVLACTGQAGPLEGEFSVEQGLGKLLASTSCDFKRVSPDTFRIITRSLVATPAAAAPSRAAAPKPAVGAEGGELIVTATRRRALADKLPYAVSVVGAEQLIGIGAADVTGLAASLAGVATTNLGPGRDKILLRGLSDGTFTGRTQSTVGIYLDETPLTSNAPDPDLRLVDVASVEVMRGPQGSLYGGGAMSGVYRIVTRKPELNVWGGSMQLGGSLTQAGAPSGEGEAVLNIPLAPDRAAARLVAYEEWDGGYIDNVDLNQKNIDGVNRAGGRMSARALFDDGWSVTTGGALQQIKSDDTQYVTSGAGRLHRANAVREGSVNLFYDGFVTLERSTGAGEFKSTTSLVEHRISSLTDASTALPLFGGSAPVGEYEEPNTTSMLIEDAVFSSPDLGRFRWLAGVTGATTLEDIQSIVRTSPDGANPAIDLYHEWRRDRRGGIAVYGEVDYALTSRLTATVGARESVSAITTNSLVVMPGPGRARAFEAGLRSGGLSPKFALDFELTPDTRLYALASQARRAGGFNTGGPIGIGFPISPTAPGMRRQFQSDELWNYEGGLKASLFDGRLKVRTAAFYDVWTNIQTDQYLASGLSYTDNAGDGRNVGTEWEVTARPAANLIFEANALINRPELTRPRPGFVVDHPTGLPGVPDVSGGGRVAYHWPLWSNWSAEFSAQAEYVGKSYVTFEAADAPPMGRYVIGQLSAQLSGPRWRAGAYLLNPTGESGNTFSYGNPFNFRQISESTPQRPRTLRITLAADF